METAVARRRLYVANLYRVADLAQAGSFGAGRALLEETDLPLEMVAVRTGFSSLQYMTTFVRRHAGITPARLRAVARAPSGPFEERLDLDGDVAGQ